MSVTVEAFRAAFPEFADVPDAAVAGALETASLLWNPGRLGKFWERIVMLSVAHRLAVRFNIGRALNAAGMKGAEAGAVNSQSASTSSLSVTNANNGNRSVSGGLRAHQLRSGIAVPARTHHAARLCGEVT